jgi:ATP-dependent RNA helicase SUPV3L1/SUV3
MAARARAVEARLSDALHARLTERFINRRTAVLMKKLGADADLLSFRLDGEEVLVEDEHIGTLEGFRFHVDPEARHADRKLLLAAAERHVPTLLEGRAESLAQAIREGTARLEISGSAVLWKGRQLGKLTAGRGLLSPQIVPDRSLDVLSPSSRTDLLEAVRQWMVEELKPLDPLRKLEEASISPEAGPELRALLIQLVEAGGVLKRAGSGIENLDRAKRGQLSRLGVRVGTLDLFVPQMIRPAPLAAWRELALLQGRNKHPAHTARQMPPALNAEGRRPPAGYRRVRKQLIRIDIAEKLLREAHGLREAGERKTFVIDPTRAISMGLTTASYAKLLQLAGFRPVMPRELSENAHGPPAPLLWRWRPSRHQPPPRGERARVAKTGAFAALAELVR